MRSARPLQVGWVRGGAVARTAEDWLALYLGEDVGPGDVTTDHLLPPELPGAARLVARQGCVVAGARHAVWLFARCGAAAVPRVRDGDRVAAGAVLLDASGPAAAILRAERTALNLLARMSGIATATRDLMDTLGAAGSGAVVAATRKTTPGFRLFEKEAVVVGGGDPYRLGLWDQAMVKDNHRAAVGDVAAAVRRLRTARPDVPVVVEAESLEDALAAAGAGADWVLIDNRSPSEGEAWAGTLRDRYPDVRVEASGGITPATVTGYGWADRISLGWLTQGVPVPDLGLDWISKGDNAPT